MAKKVQVTLVDDIDQTTAAETVSFGLDGAVYEIDLKVECTEIDASHCRCMSAARDVLVEPEAAPRGGRSTARAGREQTQAIREWARSNGYAVSDRGRVPAVVSRRITAQANLGARHSHREAGSYGAPVGRRLPPNEERGPSLIGREGQTTPGASLGVVSVGSEEFSAPPDNGKISDNSPAVSVGGRLAFASSGRASGIENRVGTLTG